MKGLTVALGLTSHQYNFEAAPHRKITSDDLEESVLNYRQVREVVRGHCERLGFSAEVDAKGNVVVAGEPSPQPLSRDEPHGRGGPEVRC